MRTPRVSRRSQRPFICTCLFVFVSFCIRIRPVGALVSVFVAFGALHGRSSPSSTCRLAVKNWVMRLCTGLGLPNNVIMMIGIM